MVHNNNCDGDRCCDEHGEVRLYPLGGGGNLILCHACWQHENRYRVRRGIGSGHPENWPQVDWLSAKTYTTA